MKTSKRLALIAVAGFVGFGAVAASALAQGDTLVTICYRNRTVQVPTYLLPRYLIVAGTTRGACVVTP